MTEKIIRSCIDVLPPPVMSRVAEAPSPAASPAPTPIPAQGALVIAKKWPNNSVLTVSFMDGVPEVQQKVEAYAHLWSRYANIRFRFVDDPNSTIRISFRQPGSWSYLGTDARFIARSQPTMNFGWLTQASPESEYSRVVVHEFGHALGLIHEHQNPAGEIPWNREAVYDYYAGPPNNWSRQQVDVNLFQKYAENQVRFTGFDRESIMLYPIPNEFTNGDFAVGWNTGLSEQDRRFITSMYPKGANELIVDAPAQQESIGQSGEIDTFSFYVSKPGRYRMETEGRSDLVMMLYGPEDDTIYITEDDDSGRRLNPRLVADLDWGKYWLRIQHFSKARTGDYSIGVYSDSER